MTSAALSGYILEFKLTIKIKYDILRLKRLIYAISIGIMVG